MRSVSLTDAELLLLDGACSEKVQKEVDGARARTNMVAENPGLTPQQAGLIADVVTEAEQNGLVLWQHTRTRSCGVCGKRAGYVKFKSGPRRGKENYDKPITFPAVEMASRFVRIQNHITVGACADCANELRPTIAAALSNVRAEVPADLAEDGRPGWKKYDRRKCPKCGWEGHTGQMRQLPTVMPGGTYPGGCPACEFESRFLGQSFESLDGFDVEVDQ